MNIKAFFLKEKKEKEADVKLKVISLFNIIIKFKLHPWNEPKLVLRFSPYTKQVTVGMLLYPDKMLSKLIRR